MNRARRPSGGDRPPDEPMLDLPLGEEEEGEETAVPLGRSASASAGTPRRLPWLLLLLLVVAGALAIGYWSRRDPPLLTASVTLLDFGVQRRAASPDERPDALELTVTNSGGRAVELRAVTVSGTAAADFAIVEDGCSGRRLRGGEGCRVRLGFAPQDDGPRQAVLAVDGDAADAPLTVPLLGVGASGRLAVVPEEVRFAPRAVSESGAAAAVTVDNRGTAAVRIEDLRLEGAAASDFRVAGCRGGELAAGESCALSVRFTPRAAGERRASLRVLSDAAGRPPLVWLIGTGQQRRAALALSPDPLDLGTALLRGEPTSGSIAVRNEGDASTRVESVTIGDSALGFAVAADRCSGRELAPGGGCEVTVRWTPAAAGPAETVLRLALTSGDSVPPLRIAGRGEGASLTAEPERLDFGSLRLGSGRESFLTLANPGRVAVPLGRIEIESGGAGSDDFALGGDCRAGARLAPAGSCTVTVRFTPRAPGDRSARLTAEAAGVRLGVPLTGQGDPPPAPRASVRPERLDFGSEAVGARGPIREVRLANGGDARLPLTGFAIEGAHAGDFRLVPGSCEGAPFIAPGAECTVGVRFVPSAAGSRSAVLVVRHGGPGGRSRVRLAANGS